MAMKTITTCFECPFFEQDSETPSAHCRAANRGGSFSGMPYIGMPYKRPGTPPDWCPARKRLRVVYDLFVPTPGRGSSQAK